MIKMPSSLRPQHVLAQVETEQFNPVASIHSRACEDRRVNHAPQPESWCSNSLQFQEISSAFVPSSEETNIRLELELELLKSGYPLHHVSCQCDESTLILSGRVRRYYYLQVTLQFAVQFARGRKIINRIEVVNHPTEICPAENL